MCTNGPHTFMQPCESQTHANAKGTLSSMGSYAGHIGLNNLLNESVTQPHTHRAYNSHSMEYLDCCLHVENYSSRILPMYYMHNWAVETMMMENA